ncbi:MAG TPA: hypothetical protein VE967_07300 [Gemmatimonadaceae bacterium]|nr:hypothetical protein [Gemmatimonadaceae bacterium]
MNAAHIHLIVNHVPVIGIVVALFPLAAGYVRRSDETIRVSLALLVLLGLSAVVAYLTGDPAEDVVKKLPDFSKELVDAHDDAAGFALGAMIAVGTGALAALIAFRRSVLPRWVAVAALAGTLFAASILARTAWLGGQIRHTEIRSNAS